MFGRGCSAGCEDNFDCQEVTASALSGHAGWCEDTFDDSVHAFENSVVARVAACSGRELDVAVAAARCGENNCNGHLLEFKNSLLNSLICHPSMHAPSLASGMFVENGGVVGVVEGFVRVILWLHVGWALHAWMGCSTMEFNLFLHALVH